MRNGSSKNRDREPSGRRDLPEPKGDSVSVNDVTDQEFEDKVLGADKPVLVDFWAEWCVPCHMVSPVVEEIASENPEKLSVAKVNVDENPDVTRRFGVMSIPSLILFAGGEEKARVVGARGKDAILKEIQPHL
jgi:thioredoxin 1